MAQNLITVMSKMRLLSVLNNDETFTIAYVLLIAVVQWAKKGGTNSSVVEAFEASVRNVLFSPLRRNSISPKSTFEIMSASHFHRPFASTV